MANGLRLMDEVREGPAPSGTVVCDVFAFGFQLREAACICFQLLAKLLIVNC